MGLISCVTTNKIVRIGYHLLWNVYKYVSLPLRLNYESCHHIPIFLTRIGINSTYSQTEISLAQTDYSIISNWRSLCACGFCHLISSIYMFAISSHNSRQIFILFSFTGSAWHSAGLDWKKKSEKSGIRVESG